MGNDVTIKITGLDKWLAQEKAKQDLSDLVVYLNGMPIKNTPIRRDGQDQLKIRLQQTSESKTAWSQLLGWPTPSSRPFTISIGHATSPPLPGQDMYVQVISGAWLTFFVVLFLLMLFLFGWMAVYSNIIRESTTLPTSPTGYKPYSLAKLQMAVWFFLILAAFLFIWIVTGQYDSITPQVLGLMGIASGTALGAAVIDNSKNQSASNELTEMRPRSEALSEEIKMLKMLEPKAALMMETMVSRGTAFELRDLDALKEAKADLARKQALLNQLDTKMKDTKSRMSELESTGSFFNDILSDANGYSFHRFQIFVWTIVLASLFVRAVLAEIAMPQFNETLLGLMGVSAGTYLGFKFPERPSKPKSA